MLLELHSFLWMNNIPLFGIYHILLIHPSVDRHLGCFHLDCCKLYCCEHWCANICLNPFSVLLGIHAGVELLGQMLNLCLTFWGTVFIHSCCTEPGLSFFPVSLFSPSPFLHFTSSPNQDVNILFFLFWSPTFPSPAFLSCSCHLLVVPLVQ